VPAIEPFPVDDLEVDPALAETYLEHLLSSLPGERPLAGLTVALDCANGAATPFAARLFERLGARVHVIADHPDGTNINLDCGSTHPERLIELVTATGSDLGVAFDGDADRAIFVDERGGIQDGDSVLFLWARELTRSGRLEAGAVVATTMSNLGLEHALAELGIRTVRCDVGDRIVVETMRRHGIPLGGEQSGHIVHLDHGSTGDGMLTAVQVSALVARADQPLSELAAPVERFPQILVNVRVAEKRPFETLPSVAAKASSIERKLGGDGRLLLRYSGTEPLARVMIEGRSQDEIEALARDLAAEIGNVLGGER
jgi:phosphoglucosamine mutase